MRFLYLFIITLFLALPAGASVFTIADISVSGEGKTALEAKENALREGEEKSFKKLLLRITPSFTSHLWPELEPEQISELVQSFDINNERITSTHYEAELNITFNKNFVEKLLMDSGVTYITKESDPIVILPLVSGPEGDKLWQNHKWSKAWGEVIDDGGFMQFVIPRGDEQDMASVNIETISKGVYPLEEEQAAGIEALLKRYKAKKILLAHVYYDEQKFGSNIRVEISDLSETYPSKTTRSFAGKAGDRQIESIMKKGASEIAGDMEKEFKAAQENSLETASSVEIYVGIEDIDQWNKLSKQLSGFDFVEKVDVKSLTVRMAKLELHFQHGYNAMIKGLAEHNLFVETIDGFLWLKYYENTPLWYRREIGMGIYEEETYDLQR